MSFEGKCDGKKEEKKRREEGREREEKKEATFRRFTPPAVLKRSTRKG